MSKFYHFHQNNSGGVWDVDDNLDINVVIEADNAEHANDRLMTLGGYFDGCDMGADCPCCGDRWYPTDEYDATEVPSIYGHELGTPYEDGEYKPWWPSAKVHFLDGIVLHFPEG